MSSVLKKADKLNLSLSLSLCIRGWYNLTVQFRMIVNMQWILVDLTITSMCDFSGVRALALGLAANMVVKKLEMKVRIVGSGTKCPTR